MNKFVNSLDNFVAEMLEGIALANPEQARAYATLQHHPPR